MSDSRDAFEKWALSRGYVIARYKALPDMYTDSFLNAAWEGWKAALACQGPVVTVSDLREVVSKMDKVGDMLDEMGSYSYTAVEDIVYSYQLDLTALIAKANGHE